MDPFVYCLAPLLAQQVDFCADPGNATSNPDAAMYECRHACENWDAPWEELEAAGCFNDQHEDQLCVTEGVYAPGEMQPWGEPCCSSCEDWDGDGSPDYEGCCEGMRSDGEMGCEDRRCAWMCNGMDCFGHEDQSTCEDNSGIWTAVHSCDEAIAEQGLIAMHFAEDEMSARGFLNSNGMQGAPSFFGLGLTNQQSAIIDQVSGQLIKASEMHRGQAERLRNLGTLSGSSTSTSSTSAHGDMRMHVARMYQADPRADLYEY